MADGRGGGGSGRRSASLAPMAIEVYSAGEELMIRDDEKPKTGRSHWCHTTSLLVGEVMGTGILGLPKAAASLGWVLSVVAMVGFALAAAYSGVLLARVKNDFHPEASSYADMARATGGRHFAAFTRCAIIATWGSILPYFLLATADSFKLIAPHDASGGLCTWHWTLIAAAVLLLPAQMQTLHAISYLTAPSSVAIIVALFLCFGGISDMAHSGSFGESTSAGVASADFLSLYSAISSVVFAYQGQSIFCEMMSEMAQPSHFPAAATVAYAIMFAMYSLATTITYGFVGKGTPGFLPDVLPDGPLRSAVGVLLAFHVLVAYLVAAQPLHAYICSRLGGGNSSASRLGRLHWLGVSSAYLAFSFLVANAIPFFSDLQGLLGALFGAPIVFGWPAFFFVSASRQHRRAISMRDGVLCALFLAVFLPIFTIFGTVSAVRDIVTDSAAVGPPFSCS